jgi:hypothetical protein
MTQTSKATQTATPTTTPDGRPGYLIACSCTTHAGHGNTAIVAFEITKKNIHGTVLLANSPSAMMRKVNERKGIWAS